MVFQKIAPHPDLSIFIEYYWMMEDDTLEAQIEKIIPDGFNEIIYNYRGLYQSSVVDGWRLQNRFVMAGQISQHFFLKNTGATGMVAVKFKPSALAYIYGVNMPQLTDQIVDIDYSEQSAFYDLYLIVKEEAPFEQIAEKLNVYFLQKVGAIKLNREIEIAISLIFKHKGIISVSAIADECCITERQLQRLFAHYIGLSPKFYMRIIQFSYIFKIIQMQNPTWSELAQLGGYFDQSHFIRNFKSFTGEDPTKYRFSETNMANFFLSE